jgi:exo-beta-1,3-glucanase (GH17 family)
VYNLSTANSDAYTIISAMDGDWSKVITISVGNEPVNDGIASVSTVVGTTSSVRTQLRAYYLNFPLLIRSAGYSGPVVAVDTFIAILDNPGLCDASDYIAANAHPFFDGGVTASEAGTWLSEQSSKLASLCGKDVLITGAFPVF